MSLLNSAQLGKKSGGRLVSSPWISERLYELEDQFLEALVVSPHSMPISENSGSRRPGVKALRESRPMAL